MALRILRQYTESYTPFTSLNGSDHFFYFFRMERVKIDEERSNTEMKRGELRSRRDEEKQEKNEET